MGFLAVLLVLIFLIALPALRLRQVGKYLHKVLEAPADCPNPPRGVWAAAVDLTNLRDRLQRQALEAQQREQRRQELVAFLAHDLKTPLTSVLGYLELLRDDPSLSQEERQKYTGIALEKARRLEDLLGEFFDMSTMDLSDIRREEVQLSLLLEQLADEFYPLFDAHDLTCVLEIAPHLTVEGDGDRLARVFDNVLRNAVSYSAPGAAVKLTAAQEGSFAVTRISNVGLEIPEKELSNIFRKFYRLDAARSSRTGGAGLGLAIAREIVELHGGTISAESTGLQTTFTVSIPLKPTHM